MIFTLGKHFRTLDVYGPSRDPSIHYGLYIFCLLVKVPRKRVILGANPRTRAVLRLVWPSLLLQSARVA